MSNVYALIQNGVVVNTVLANSTDPQDSNYTWVNITSIVPQPSTGWSYSGTTFTGLSAPALTPTQTYTNIVLAAMTFGQQLMVQFAVQNILAGITQAGQSANLLAYTANLSQAITTGSLYVAIAQIEAMIADTSSAKTNLSPFITNAVLYIYLNQIQAYLGVAITPNPGS